jgi:hypothetical protein
MDMVIPCLPCCDPQERDVVRYHAMRHIGCNLPETSPLEDHLKFSFFLCALHSMLICLS